MVYLWRCYRDGDLSSSSLLKHFSVLYTLTVSLPVDHLTCDMFCFIWTRDNSNSSTPHTFTYTLNGRMWVPKDLFLIDLHVFPTFCNCSYLGNRKVKYENKIITNRYITVKLYFQQEINLTANNDEKWHKTECIKGRITLSIMYII